MKILLIVNIVTFLFLFNVWTRKDWLNSFLKLAWLLLAVTNFVALLNKLT